jgi:hypothetical protein
MLMSDRYDASLAALYGDERVRGGMTSRASIIASSGECLHPHALVPRMAPWSFAKRGGIRAPAFARGCARNACIG